MKTDTSCTKSPAEDTCKPEKMSKSFRDISKYFSEEEWAKLTKWQKSAYVFMKRNYIRMTGLGVKVNQPVFMRGKESLMKESDEDYGHESDDEHSERIFGTVQTKGLKDPRGVMRGPGNQDCKKESVS
nr:protein SSXA1-like isoform X2 [Peromyscus maniculatus bairdii]